MAVVVSPESDIISTCPLELCFDLDLALTMPESSSGIPPTESLLSNMPTVAAVDVCTVCMQTKPGEGGRQMPCGHVYHAPCISSWLSLHNSCPLCRCNISSEV